MFWFLVTLTVANLQYEEMNGNVRETEGEKDQGFTRPRILVLVPMRNIAYDVVTRLLKFVSEDIDEDEVKTKVANKKRFKEEFYQVSQNRSRVVFSSVVLLSASVRASDFPMICWS